MDPPGGAGKCCWAKGRLENPVVPRPLWPEPGSRKYQLSIVQMWHTVEEKNIKFRMVAHYVIYKILLVTHVCKAPWSLSFYVHAKRCIMVKTRQMPFHTYRHTLYEWHFPPSWPPQVPVCRWILIDPHYPECDPSQLSSLSQPPKCSGLKSRFNHNFHPLANHN